MSSKKPHDNHKPEHHPQDKKAEENTHHEHHPERHKLTIYHLTSKTASGMLLKDAQYGVAVPLPSHSNNLKGIKLHGSGELKLGDVILVNNQDDEGKNHKCVMLVNDYGGMPKAALDISAVKHGRNYSSPIANKLGLTLKQGSGGVIILGEGKLEISVVANIQDIGNLDKGEHQTINSAIAKINHNLSDKHTTKSIKQSLKASLAKTEIKLSEENNIEAIDAVAKAHSDAITSFKDVCLSTTEATDRLPLQMANFKEKSNQGKIQL